MILVTGATGIVGSHILVELLLQGKTVRAIVREGANRIAMDQLLREHEIVDPTIDYVHGDILDPMSLESAMDGCDEVYHCAAKVSFSPSDEKDLFTVNVNGTANVVDACLSKAVKKLCYISSTAAIGDELIEGKRTEQSTWTSDKGRSAYSLSKRYAELEVMRGREEGLNSVIVNPGVVIGPGKWGESSTSLILSCKNGMTFYPPGSNGFVSAEDVAKFCMLAMNNGLFEDRFILVSENLSFQELFKMISSAFGQGTPKILVPKGLLSALQKGLRTMEKLNMNPFSMTAENLQSSYKSVVFENTQAKSISFSFTNIQDAVDATVKCYRTI